MSLKTKERLALLLMSNDEDSKRFLIYLVYQTIRKNNGITVNQICSLLMKKFFIPRDKIEATLAVLTNTQLFDSVSTFEEKPGVIHLRCKRSEDIAEWLSDFCNKIPEACNFDAPLYGNKKVNNDNTSIAKV